MEIIAFDKAEAIGRARCMAYAQYDGVKEFEIPISYQGWWGKFVQFVLRVRA
jgi:hypothetical protein